MKKIVSILVALALLVSMVPTVFAVGEYDDPEVITALGDYTITMPESGSYYMSYTATEKGMLKIASESTGDFYISIWNESTYDGSYAGSYMGAYEADVLVNEGDLVSISIETYDPTFSFTLSLGEVYYKLDLFEDEESFPCDSALIPAGGSVKYKVGDFLYGGKMTVTGAGAYVEIGEDKLLADEDGVIYVDFTQYEGEPVVDWMGRTNYYYDMFIGNSGAEDAYFEIGYWFPEGTQANPKDAEAGVTYECTVEPEDDVGYFYTFTAPTDCVVTVTVEGENWAYQMMNLDTYVQNDWHNSFEGHSNTDTIVAYGPDNDDYTFGEGDVIRVNVNGLSMEEGAWASYVGGTFKVTFSYKEVDIYPGSQYEPYRISAYDEFPQTFNLAAGTSAYYKLNGFGGMNFTMTGEGGYVIVDGVKHEAVDGVVSIPVSDYSVVVEIGNSSDADVTYEVANPYPLGNYNNPYIIELDKEYALDFVAGDDTCCMTYTAEVGGELTIHVLSETGWQYTMSTNDWFSNGVQNTGSQHYTSDPVCYKYTVDLAAGKTATAYIGTNDGNGYSYSGCLIDDTVKVIYTFKPYLTLGENTVELEEDDADGDSWTYVAEQSGILDISVTGIKLYDMYGELIELTEDDLLGYFTRNGGNFHLSVNGVDILNPSQQILVSWGDVVEIEMYNMVAAWAEIDLELTMIDYTELVLGDNEFTDDGNGSYFVYYPETDGNLTLEFTELYYYDSVEIAMPWHPCLPISDAAALVGMTVNGVAVAENPVTVAVEAGTPVVIYLCDTYGREIKGSLNLSVKAVETIYDLPYTLEGELTADDCEEGLLWKYTATQTGVIIGTSENVDDVDAWVTVYVNGEPYNLFDGVIVYEGDEVVFNLAAYEAGSYSCELSWMELVLGDVNLDGNVDILDANLAAAYYNERVELSDLQIGLADVNGVDGVDILDANLIAAFYNERIDKFPVEE